MQVRRRSKRPPFMKKAPSIILFMLLLNSFSAGLFIQPINAQTVEISNVLNPVRVRVREFFRCDIEIYYEATGPVTLDYQIHILDDAGSMVSEDSFHKEVVEGVEEATTVDWKNSLTAPDRPVIWNLRAVLVGGNEWPFSIEVVGDDSPPYVVVTSLNADPSSLQVGDDARIEGGVDYSIPDGSRFEIRYTSSYGIPEVMGGFGYSLEPWICLPEDIPSWIPTEELRRAGEMLEEGGATSNSGSDTFNLYTYAPLESMEWVWYFRIVYFSPEGEELQLGSRDLSIEVSTRSEGWAVIDNVWGGYAIPTVPFNVEFTGRYFFPEGDDATHDIGIELWDVDRDALVLEDSRHDVTVAGAGILLESFLPRAPEEDFESLHLRAELQVDEVSVDSYDFTVFRASSDPVSFYSLVIDHVGRPPEIEYGTPLELGVRVTYLLPPDRFTEIELTVFQPGVGPLCSEYVDATGDDWSLVEILVPPEFVPPRNGDWHLVIIARADPDETTHLYHEFEFIIAVVGAEGGIRGGVSDWAVVDGWPSNPTPFMGDEETFWATIRVETSDPLPQQVWLSLTIDGGEMMEEAITYQDGMDYYSFQSIIPWTATIGPHTAVWIVDPDEAYTDPNRGNNEFTFTFTVSEVLPPTPDGGLLPPEEEPPPEAEFDFYVTATPTERTLASSVTYTVVVDLASGRPEQVQLTLEDVPAGLTYSFNPSSGIPPYTSELSITGSRHIPASSYSMMIKATDGEKERYKPIILNVEEGAKYELAASPKTIHARAGNTAECTLSISSETGYSNYVNLDFLGAPPGAIGRIEPTYGKPDFQSILLLEIGEDVKPGVYSLTVSGSGSQPKRVALTLIVTGGDSQPVIDEEKGERSTFAYYLPLIYIVAIIAAIVLGITAVWRYRKRPSKGMIFCIECGKKIPFGTEFCPECGAQQKEI